MLKKTGFFIFFIYFLINISACSTSTTVQTLKRTDNENPRLIQIAFEDYFQGDDLSLISLLQATKQSENYLNRLPDKKLIRYGKYNYTAAEAIESLKLFREIVKKHKHNKVELLEHLEDNFLFLKSPGNNDGEVLFTGYYEPVFEGSLVRTEKYNVPMYSKPDDLISLPLGTFRSSLKAKTIVCRIEGGEIVPYYTRKEIMAKGVLFNKSAEIAWLKNPVDLFFMQVQGSGILKTPDGKMIRFGYNGANGRPYTSIGKVLLDEGKIPLEKISMQSIREYLKNNPEEMNRILFQNKSYTFFRKLEAKPGPLGNIQVPLTPQRSIATDTRYFPKGGLVYLITDVPHFDKNFKHIGTRKIARFVMNQDTGGAIRGYSRADLFWGNGSLAEESAGRMRGFGDMIFIIAHKEVLKFRKALAVEEPKNKEPNLN